MFAERGDGAVLEFEPLELPQLVEFCRLTDDVERIRDELKGELLAAGSKGQRVPHPLRVELHRTIATRLAVAKALNLPDEGSAASWAGRNLARQRWSA